MKLGSKRSEKRLSAITELTTIMCEDKLPKLEPGLVKKENSDSRDREREWKKKNNHHITHNHAHVSPVFSYCKMIFGRFPSPANFNFREPFCHLVTQKTSIRVLIPANYSIIYSFSHNVCAKASNSVVSSCVESTR